MLLVKSYCRQNIGRYYKNNVKLKKKHFSKEYKMYSTEASILLFWVTLPDFGYKTSIGTQKKNIEGSMLYILYPFVIMFTLLFFINCVTFVNKRM